MDQNNSLNSTVRSWQRLFKLGAICALLGIGISFLEIGLSFLPGGAHTASESISAATWFERLQLAPLFEMRNLGLVNIFFVSVGVPLFAALFVALRKEAPAGGLLALGVNLIGAAVFFATNRAFAMYSLSSQYAVATSNVDRSALLAAGEAMLAVGGSHSMGSFLAFFISEIAGLIVSVAMLHSKAFGRLPACMGILAFSSLMLFEVCSAFIPMAFGFSSTVAMVGGLLSVIWYLLTAIRLLKIRE